jgi:hypothetical protein
MSSNIQQIYQQTILPLSERERLQLAALIITDLSRRAPATDNITSEGGPSKRKGGIREMFGTWSSGNPKSADNEQIDADLAKAYADNHEGED